MTFRQRFMYYLIGVGLGLVAVSFFFRDRGCAWTPANRVLANIAYSQIMISDSMKCVLKANKIDEDDIFQMFRTGDVDFDNSQPNDTPKVYLLLGKTEAGNRDFKIRFVIHAKDSMSIIAGLEMKNMTKTCDNLNASVVRYFQMPDKTIKKLLKDKKLIASDSLWNSIHENGIKDGDMYIMIQYGNVDLENSQPMAKPHPIYFIAYKNYRFSVEMAEERAYLLSFSKQP